MARLHGTLSRLAVNVTEAETVKHVREPGTNVAGFRWETRIKSLE